MKYNWESRIEWYGNINNQIEETPKYRFLIKYSLILLINADIFDNFDEFDCILSRRVNVISIKFLMKCFLNQYNVYTVI